MRRRFHKSTPQTTHFLDMNLMTDAVLRRMKQQLSDGFSIEHVATLHKVSPAQLRSFWRDAQCSQ